MLAAVAEFVDDPDQAPALQFLEAGADIRAGDVERLANFVRRHRLRREHQQRVDLRHRAVDAPAPAHLPPVEDELLHRRGEFHGYFCKFRNKMRQGRSGERSGGSTNSPNTPARLRMTVAWVWRLIQSSGCPDVLHPPDTHRHVMPFTSAPPAPAATR